MDDYKKGVADVIEAVKPLLPDTVWQNLQKNAQSFVTDSLPAIATMLASEVESIGFQLLMFIIYLLFWVFEPLPVSPQVAQLFKSYLVLETLVCLLFATLMSFLLICLQCKIWPLFF